MPIEEISRKVGVAKRPFTLRTRFAAKWFAGIGLILCVAGPGRSNDASVDPRARFVSPVEGQRFAPGDTVHIVVRAAAPLAAVFAGVGVGGVGVLELSRDADGVTYRGRFVIPEDSSGSFSLTLGGIDARGNPFEGTSVTIVVRPATAPQSVSPLESYHRFSSVGTKARVYVTGNYPGGVTRDLSSSVTGTVYASSDPRVVRVDPEGNVEAVGLGTASVSATNGSPKTFFTFVVEDVGHPLPPEELTARVRFEKSSLELDPALTSRQKTPIYAQTVTITNTSDWPLIGPLHLTVQDLPKEGWLFGFPGGRPVYYLGLFPKDGLTLAPGGRVTTTLRFIALRSPTAPDYRLGIIRFTGDPRRLQ